MLTILIDNMPLYIPSATSLTMEQTASWADLDNITADIVWTFDVPAEQNARIFQQAHHIVVSQHAGYDCEIRFDGVPIARGTLYIQQTSNEERYSCGITFNHLGLDWGGKKLAEGEYGQDIQISEPTATLDEHRANFRQFLRSSLSADSWYKFFLAYAPDFYSNNDDFGYYLGELSHLQNSLAQDLAAKFLNRLFVDSGGNLIEQPDKVNGAPLLQGLRIFNHNGNGYAFAPAVRLVWFLRQMFNAAGAQLFGSFLSAAQAQTLFMQSRNAMDGDLSQLNIYEHLYINTGVTGVMPSPLDGTENAKPIDVGVNDLSFPAFRINGDTAPLVRWSFVYNTDTLQHQQIATTYAKPFTRRDEVLVLLFRTKEAVAAGKFPQARAVVDSTATQNRDFVYGDIPSQMRFAPTGTSRFVMGDNNSCTWFDGLSSVYTDVQFLNVYDNVYCIQLTSSEGDTVPSQPTQDADVIGSLFANVMLRLDPDKDWVVELAKMQVDSVQHGAWNGQWNTVTNSIILPNGTQGQSAIKIPVYGQLEYVEVLETIERANLASTNSLTNIFDIALRLNEHLPDMTNAELLKALCQAFGLNMYVGGADRSVQLSFFSDLFAAGGIAIDGYVTASRRLTYNPTRYKLNYPSLLQQRDLYEGYQLEDIITMASLPPARTYKRKSVFVINENAYRLSTLDTESNLYSWQTNAGNNRPLVVNEEADNEVEVKPDIQVPNMHVCDAQRTPKYLLHLNGQGNSKLFDDDYTGAFDMCLVQYRGRQLLQLQQTADNNEVYTEAYYEAANPTRYNADGTTDDSTLSLTATGEGSTGESWAKPMYDFMAKREEFEFTVHVPGSMFLRLYCLMQPQHEPAPRQLRWLYYRSQRYLPSRISYQFSALGDVVATITCSR